jgi:hypothetical protein
VDLGARPIARVRLVRGARSVEASLPFPALALSRKTFDDGILKHAAACGVNVIRGKMARSIEQSDQGGFEVSFGAGDSVLARTYFLPPASTSYVASNAPRLGAKAIILL